MENVKYGNSLFEENMKLVDYTLNRYFYDTSNDYDVYEDMKQIGLMALYRASENYTKSKGKFSTFAVRSIKNAMLNFVNNDIYKYCKKGGELSIYETRGLDEDTSRTMEDMMGEFFDFSEIEANEILDFINRYYKDDRYVKIVCMLEQGFTYKEIGKTLGVSKQRINQLVYQLQQDLLSNSKELHIENYSFENETEKVSDKKVIAFNEDGYYKEFCDYIEASKELGVDKYMLKRALISKNTKAKYRCKNKNNIKLHFKLLEEE